MVLLSGTFLWYFVGSMIALVATMSAAHTNSNFVPKATTVFLIVFVPGWIALAYFLVRAWWRGRWGRLTWKSSA